MTQICQNSVFMPACLMQGHTCNLHDYVSMHFSLTLPLAGLQMSEVRAKAKRKNVNIYVIVALGETAFDE